MLAPTIRARRALLGTLQDALDVDPAPSSPTVLEDVPRPQPDMSDDAAQAQREADAPAVGTVRKAEDAPGGDAERAAWVHPRQVGRRCSCAGGRVVLGWWFLGGDMVVLVAAVVLRWWWWWW